MTDTTTADMPESSFTWHIGELLEHARKHDGMTVRDAVRILGQDSIALALVFFTLLSSLPLFSIPGFTTLTGIPIILLGGQLLFAAQEIWLPKRLQNRRLKSQKLWRFMERALPKLKALEKRLKPRMLFMSMIPMRYVLGAAFVVMGILLALPIPLINFPAGFSMFLLALGLLERDGLLITIGLFCVGLMLSGMGYAGLALGEGLDNLAS